MGETTGISWTDHTFNPWWGCVKVSPACQHCYAETFAKRVGQPVWGIESPRRFFGPNHWAEPLKWNEAAKRDAVRRRVFCASMADVFEDRDDLRGPRTDLFALIKKTEYLDWLLLTKRPENIRSLWPRGFYESGRDWWPNLWLGVTAETQEYFDSRVPLLMNVPAVVRFVSYEPALGPLTVRDWKLDWLIAGGESGAGCREPEPQWFTALRDECVARGIAFHFKQWGGFHPKANGRLLDGREWLEFPVSGQED